MTGTRLRRLAVVRERKRQRARRFVAEWRSGSAIAEMFKDACSHAVKPTHLIVPEEMRFNPEKLWICHD
jgi:hypothetical protein